MDYLIGWDKSALQFQILKKINFSSPHTYNRAMVWKVIFRLSGTRRRNGSLDSRDTFTIAPSVGSISSKIKLQQRFSHKIFHSFSFFFSFLFLFQLGWSPQPRKALAPASPPTRVGRGPGDGACRHSTKLPSVTWRFHVHLQLTSPNYETTSSAMKCILGDWSQFNRTSQTSLAILLHLYQCSAPPRLKREAFGLCELLPIKPQNAYHSCDFSFAFWYSARS